ncbi:8080_t:CDS:2, partial [Gigaspora rosea]
KYQPYSCPVADLTEKNIENNDYDDNNLKEKNEWFQYDENTSMKK